MPLPPALPALGRSPPVRALAVLAAAAGLLLLLVPISPLRAPPDPGLRPALLRPPAPLPSASPGADPPASLRLHVRLRRMEALADCAPAPSGDAPRGRYFLAEATAFHGLLLSGRSASGDWRLLADWYAHLSARCRGRA